MSLTYQELLAVKKFFDEYMYQLPSLYQIPDFVDSLIAKTSYNKDKHYNNEKLERRVSKIVDMYFKEHGTTVYPFGVHRKDGCFVITPESIRGRKDTIVDELKEARDNGRHTDFIYHHYDGGACATTEEFSSFYWYVFDRYYQSIGTKWKYG